MGLSSPLPKAKPAKRYRSWKKSSGSFARHDVKPGEALENKSACCRKCRTPFDSPMNSPYPLMKTEPSPPMEYVVLVYMDQERWAEVPVDERNRIHAAAGAWHEDLVKKGKSLRAVGLQPPGTATTLRERQGKMIVTDGPFAETKEILGGFEIIQCDHLDEALQIAHAFPVYPGLSLEVRPLVVGGECKD
jgi:hypothetical protein